MIRGILTIFLFFIIFYSLFWNIKRWTLDGWKLAGTVALCAVVASVGTVAAIVVIQIIFA